MSQIATPSLAPSAPPAGGAPAAPNQPSAAPATPPATPNHPAGTGVPPAAPATPAAPAAPAAPAQPAAPSEPSLSLKPVSSDAKEVSLTDIFQRAGLDARKVAEEFTTTGQVSDDTVRMIKAADESLKFLPKAVIQQFVQGQAAVHQLNVMRIETAQRAATEVAGGTQQLENLKAWASNPANVEPSRMASFERMIKSDPSVYPDVVRLLASEYSAKGGFAGSRPLVQGGQPASGGPKPSNAAEMSALMSRVTSGDRTALATLNSMTQAEINGFLR